MVVKKKFTLTKLFNTLMKFEGELQKYFMNMGFKNMENLSKERLNRLKDMADMIVVEMTLEPIYTINPSETLNKIVEIRDEREIARELANFYNMVAEDVRNISMELSNLLQDFSSVLLQF